MTWEMFVGIAKKFGYTKDWDWISNGKGYYFSEDGNFYIYINFEKYVIASDRTPDQMYQIMLALEK